MEDNFINESNSKELNKIENDSYLEDIKTKEDEESDYLCETLFIAQNLNKFYIENLDNADYFKINDFYYDKIISDDDYLYNYFKKFDYENFDLIEFNNIIFMTVNRIDSYNLEESPWGEVIKTLRVILKDDAQIIKDNIEYNYGDIIPDSYVEDFYQYLSKIYIRRINENKNKENYIKGFNEEKILKSLEIPDDYYKEEINDFNNFLVSILSKLINKLNMISKDIFDFWHDEKVRAKEILDISDRNELYYSVIDDIFDYYYNNVEIALLNKDYEKSQKAYKYLIQGEEFYNEDQLEKMEKLYGEDNNLED